MPMKSHIRDYTKKYLHATWRKTYLKVPTAIRKGAWKTLQFTTRGLFKYIKTNTGRKYNFWKTHFTDAAQLEQHEADTQPHSVKCSSWARSIMSSTSPQNRHARGVISFWRCTAELGEESWALGDEGSNLRRAAVPGFPSGQGSSLGKTPLPFQPFRDTASKPKTETCWFQAPFAGP